MKIAIMMRAMDQDSGFRAYVMGLVENMLQIDESNSYLLLYRTTKWTGHFSSYKNVKEILLQAAHKFIWDQVAVPYRAWQEGADIIFNPKFSVPLISHCPVAMGLQEPAWWVWPKHYERFDVLYQKIMLPLYCRKSAHLFPMAKFNLEETRKCIGLPLNNATVTYTVPGKQMRPMEDRAELEKFRRKYQLPDRYILSVTRVDHPGLDKFEKGGSFHPGKNPETTLRAFIQCRKDLPHKLVFAGRRIRDYMLHLGFKDADFEDVIFIPFVPYEELPELYNNADLFVVASYYDGCSTVIMEAMACGCPVVASATGGFPEISGGAAIHADPHDPADFSRKFKLVLLDEKLRKELKKKSLERASFFNWQRTAKLTLEGLDRAVRKRIGNSK